MTNQLELRTDPNGYQIYKTLVTDNGIHLGHGKLYVKVPTDKALDLNIMLGLRQFYASGARIELYAETFGSYYMLEFERAKGPEVKMWGVDDFTEVYQVPPIVSPHKEIPQ